ncbi:LEAF RUST 10 DISEASE-RESISTANCE LOCUS RECEPTOR-LIKE PROTEIN KINASE-like 2.1 [Quercus lobata]|uniref:LEAF RUST 10 DISEASE-RESISTANCE LOCUS RECEPTOR-LIKE PROTEIN KINASE-like 2.1 n=1 Tax=Quercus lobata TaxID=97700 RepID=UPI001248F258|nr:LEAF RUST 10 DISEASE-RESISTANCE LOCUS RECEPTOR-LIKE PROTEIN KINASE-like 2.1 [Quercus lobata]
MYPLIFFFFFFLFLSVAPDDECYHQPPFDCGPFKNLSYPFTYELQPSQSHCGQPEFRLTNCAPTDSPELTISPLTYRVLRLNQANKTMTLARSDLWNNTCLADQFNNSTILNSTILDYTTDNEDLTIYYGCFFKFTEMRILPTNLFNCSSVNEEMSASFYITGRVPTDPILNITTCHVGVTLKILQTAAFQLTSKQASLREVLMEGFNVNYSNCISQPCPKPPDNGNNTGLKLGKHFIDKLFLQPIAW